MEKLILIDPQGDLTDAFNEQFLLHNSVEVQTGYFQEVANYDCMVSAANSFGLMDGGVDLAIRDFFGFDLQTRVQQRIIEEYRGEQPVGTSMIVATNHPKHPYIAHTPTMRIPYKITRLDNIYNAMFSMLLAVHNHNKNQPEKRAIKTVLCPGLGTATGGVPRKEAARQMELAYRHFTKPPKSIDWTYASNRQRAIIFGGDLFG